MWRIVKIAVLPGYRLEVEFADGVAGIAQPRQPIRSTGVERFGIATHDFYEQQLAQAAEHALPADSRFPRLGERELHVSRERAAGRVLDVDRVRQRHQQRVVGTCVATEVAADDVRRLGARSSERRSSACL